MNKAGDQKNRSEWEEWGAARKERSILSECEEAKSSEGEENVGRLRGGLQKKMLKRKENEGPEEWEGRHGAVNGTEKFNQCKRRIKKQDETRIQQPANSFQQKEVR